MCRLAERTLAPVAPADLPGSWYRGLRVMALDGSCLEVPDEAANAACFGYPRGARDQGAFRK